MILHNIVHSVKKTSRIRSRTVKGLVSVSSRLLGVSVSVSSRMKFSMSRSRLGLGREGLVSIPDNNAKILTTFDPFNFNTIKNDLEVINVITGINRIACFYLGSD